MLYYLGLSKTQKVLYRKYISCLSSCKLISLFRTLNNGKNVFLINYKQMKLENSSKIISNQGCLAQILGGALIGLRIIIILTIGSDTINIIAQVLMSSLCLATGFLAKKSSKTHLPKLASRYAFWALVNFLAWTILGTICSILQLVYMSSSSFNDKPGISVILTMWFTVFISGCIFLYIFLKVARTNSQNCQYGLEEDHEVDKHFDRFEKQSGSYFMMDKQRQMN